MKLASKLISLKLLIPIFYQKILHKMIHIPLANPGIKIRSAPDAVWLVSLVKFMGVTPEIAILNQNVLHNTNIYSVDIYKLVIHMTLLYQNIR